ncbi:MAG TPA: SMI1/KNR4 family protein [Kofleriaceae bacterium]|jgi:hypothetical protein
MTTTDFQWIDDTLELLGVQRYGHPSKATAADMARLEARLGHALPAVYRYFLARYGGCAFGGDEDHVVVTIHEQNPSGRITAPEVFYALDPSHSYSIERALDTYAGRIPSGVLPISSDAGGNQICLDVGGDYEGSVWVWDHEQRWFTGSLQAIADELDQRGVATQRLSVHHILRAWARLHPERFTRSPDYEGMYAISATFEDFLRALRSSSA